MNTSKENNVAPLVGTSSATTQTAGHPFRYFCGDGSNLGRVRALPDVKTFADLINRVLRKPERINMYRSDFLALPKKERDLAKRVKFITPAAFKSEDCQRISENALCCNLLALDIDDPLQADPLARDPEKAADALAGLTFALYKTASHTPECPRLRILVDAVDTPLDRYGEAVAHIAQLLGLRDITRESLVPVQPMYLPTIFLDEELL